MSSYNPYEALSAYYDMLKFAEFCKKQNWSNDEMLDYCETTRASNNVNAGCADNAYWMYADFLDVDHTYENYVDFLIGSIRESIARLENEYGSQN